MRLKIDIRKMQPLIYLLPTFFFLAIFTYYPIARSLYLSFFAYNQAQKTPAFIGFSNYIRLVKDPVFWEVMKNTLIYVGVTVPVTVGLGLLLALLVWRLRPGAAFYKASYFYPTVIPMSAGAMIWLFMFIPRYGVVNYLLQLAGLNPVDWTTSRAVAIWSLIIVYIWKYAGYYMILILAGLTQLPLELYEAATIDGASPFRKFLSITVPLLSPTLFFVGVIAVINGFQVVDQVYLMTKGGPGNASNMLVYYIYQIGFRFWDIGYASTLTTVLLFLLLIFTIFAIVVIEKRVFYAGGEIE